jgi:hypothetical protein
MPDTKCPFPVEKTDCPMQAYYEARINGVEDKLQYQLEANKEALGLARIQLEARLTDLNHLKAQMLADRDTLMPRESYELNHRNLEQRLDQTRDRIFALEKVAANYEGKLWMLMAIMGFLFTVLQVCLKLFFK